LGHAVAAVESLELMGEMVNKLFSTDATHPVKRRSGIIITHTAHMLKYVRADKAHVDCTGILLDSGKEGFIVSMSGLKALHTQARMSHEASIGKISPEQVEYLQARGMEKPEVVSMIIRGFLDTDIEGLGPELDAKIAEIAQLAGHGEE